MNRLAGKVALISGGARGQGATETRMFVNEGAAVVFGDVLDDEGKKLETESKKLKDANKNLDNDARKAKSDVDRLTNLVASLEQHGPHLPVWTDSFIGHSVSVRAAELCADLPAVVLPPMWMGLSEHHFPFGGTITACGQRRRASVIGIALPTPYGRAS